MKADRRKDYVEAVWNKVERIMAQNTTEIWEAALMGSMKNDAWWNDKRKEVSKNKMNVRECCKNCGFIYALFQVLLCHLYCNGSIDST